jgi:RNA polymerase sigma factor (sigma-70 family)
MDGNTVNPIELMRKIAIPVNDAYVLWRMKTTEENKNIFGASIWAYCEKILSKDFHFSLRRSSRKQHIEHTMHCSGGEVYFSIDDLIQDACLQIWEDLDSFKGNSSFATWARKSINGRTIKTLRRTQTDTLKDPTELDVEYDPYDTLNMRLDLETFKETLSERDNLFLHLKLEGFSEAELGEHFDESAEWANDTYRNITVRLQKFYGKS